MAHKKASGAARQHAARPGKRLGLKMYEGQKVKTGNIIVRQKGTTVHAGEGLAVARDHSLYAIKDGILEFKKKLGKVVAFIK